MAENYLAMKKNEVLINATMWTNLEKIKLRVRSQAQRSHMV